MINEGNDNVKLTFDQLQAIDVVEKRLGNLQSEINIATKNLTALKKDTDRIYKEKTYQEELLANLTKQTEDKTKEISDLKANITEHTAMLNNVLAEYKDHTEKIATGKADHSAREDMILKKETELAEKSEELNGKLTEHQNNVSDFFSKVAKLKEVTSTF